MITNISIGYIQIWRKDKSNPESPLFDKVCSIFLIIWIFAPNTADDIFFMIWREKLKILYSEFLRLIIDIAFCVSLSSSLFSESLAVNYINNECEVWYQKSKIRPYYLSKKELSQNSMSVPPCIASWCYFLHAKFST